MTEDGTLLQLAAVDPRRAHAAALARLDAPAATVRVEALRAAALSGLELGRLEESLAHLQEALATAERAGLTYAAAQVRMSLVAMLVSRGDLAGALAAADAAAPVLRGEDADRLQANRVCALARSGRLHEALAIARRPRTAKAQPGLLINAALARATCGDLDAAEPLLAEAAELADRAGLRHEAAMARANLAYVASQRGDVPRALRLYAEAEPGLVGARVAQTRLDRAQTLVAAGLAAEARPLITAALAEIGAAGYGSDLADGLLLLARAELADGDPEKAAETAERARTAFADQGRAGWTLLAEHLLVRARWAAGDRSAVFFQTAVATADRLDRGGWAQEAADGRIVAALLALRLGRPASALLDQVSAARRHGPAALRAAAWHATALERHSRGDRQGAMAAVRAGLRVVDEHAAALGAPELRAHAARLGADLGDLGLRLAGDARALLSAEERRRAIMWRTRERVVPPADPRCAVLLTELRMAGAEHTATTAAGRDARETAARLLRLEAELRARTRMRSGTPPGDAASGAGRADRPLRALAASLGDRALVELVRAGETLYAVTVVAGRCRRWTLGCYADVAHDALLLRSAVRRLAWHGGGSPGGPRPPGSGAEPSDAARRLEARLPAPLRRAVGDRELVLAPTGVLRGLPWSALPMLAGRPVSVVPSAAAWLRARRQAGPPEPARGGGPVVLVAGPGLRHSEPEVTAIAGIRPGASVLCGPAAAAETVRDALDGAELAHLAAHGEFRGGNPSLSGLLMADGPLLTHDLEGLARPPRVVVLSACDGGRAEGVMGLASVLLAAGTTCVIASVTPVRDDAARDLMVRFHRLLATGLSPARALAAAPRTPGVLGFQCFGTG
ncbi:CHAT domain-containing protein [Actinomadura scrupuli]|uniref:CHAT domain-containing protein n=1 Tax=Actinomadura scrupuli TaxID=559629 RepID=UPI003D9795EF